MSGCYRCGLPDGSESRLCETCFIHKFGASDPVIDGDATEPATGIELTPRMQRWILSSGAVAYLAVVSFGIVVQGQRAQLQQTNVEEVSMQRDLVAVGGNDFPVRHRQEFGFLAGPAGDLISD